MELVGVDIGTNYTKVTSDGKKVLVFPSLVVYGEEKDWSLKSEIKNVYIGNEALSIVQSMENVEVLRPLHEGRVLHESYLELANYGLSKLNISKVQVIATGLPVKSSKKEREELKMQLEKELSSKVLIFPEPVGTLAYLGIETGVCVDIGFGTTDIIVLADMEFLKGDTMLMGVDKLFEGLEVAVRNKIGISLTPEEMTDLLIREDHEVGRIRGGKKISVKKEHVINDYESLVQSWVDRIASRVKLVLEGLSTSLVENFVLTGGGSLLPGVYDAFAKSFEEIGEIKKPDDPLKSNAAGYYMLAKAFIEETEPEKETEKSEKLEKDEKVEKEERKIRKRKT